MPVARGQCGARRLRREKRKNPLDERVLFVCGRESPVLGGKPSVAQCVARYFGYIVAMLPFCVGIIWVAFDKRKQGWHDKLAGTVVIRPKKKTADVAFEERE